MWTNPKLEQDRTALLSITTSEQLANVILIFVYMYIIHKEHGGCSDTAKATNALT